MRYTPHGPFRRAISLSPSVLRRSLAALGALALTLPMAPALASPAWHTPTGGQLATRPIIFGASGGKDQVDNLAAAIGAPLAVHAYGRLDGPVLTGRLINIQPTVTWRTVASAQPGSATYNDIARWADTLKGRSGPPLLVSFSHEPEGATSDWLGSASDFIAAYRHVRDVFQARGVRNVEYTWNMTSNAFRVPPNDDRYAPHWYPGDAYVDNVATAAYNWYNCGEGRGEWLSLANRAAAPLAFAEAHSKPYVLAEWASQQGAQRAQWLRDAQAWFLANIDSIRGAFYYQTSTPRAGCSWRLTAPDELTAFGAMARDRVNFGG